MFNIENEGKTVFYFTENSNKIVVFYGIINLANENLTTEVVKKLFLATDNEGGTVFHRAANVNETEVFHVIFNLTKENVTKEEIKNYF